MSTAHPLPPKKWPYVGSWGVKDVVAGCLRSGNARAAVGRDLQKETRKNNNNQNKLCLPPTFYYITLCRCVTRGCAKSLAMVPSPSCFFCVSLTWNDRRRPCTTLPVRYNLVDMRLHRPWLEFPSLSCTDRWASMPYCHRTFILSKNSYFWPKKSFPTSKAAHLRRGDETRWLSCNSRCKMILDCN